MPSRLTPCPSCTRHVKVGPPTCPFCGGDVPVPAPRAVSLPVGKPLTRVAIALAGAAAVSACSSSSTSGPAPTVDASADADSGHPIAAYGTPVFDAGHDASEAGQPQPAYGAMIPDAGLDTGGTQALYGPAMIPDASADVDSGQVIAAYGAPPMDASGQ